MVREIWGLEIEPPDALEESMARDGLGNQLIFTIRVARFREGALFVYTPSISKWASDPIHRVGKGPNDALPELGKINVFLKNGVLQMGHMSILPTGYSLFRHVKEGRAGSLMELKTVEWLKKNFSGFMIQELNPTKHRIVMLHRRKQALEKPIPVEKLWTLIRDELVVHHTNQYKGPKKRFRRFLRKLNLVRRFRERYRR